MNTLNMNSLTSLDSEIKSEFETSFRTKLIYLKDKISKKLISISLFIRNRFQKAVVDERGDVPGWVLVVLMTTGLVTAIWAIAKPNLTSILNNSLNSMNGVR